MGSLLNDWIQLFDEKNFQKIKDEPPLLRTITMLFVTIQKEFRKVEIALNDKVQTYKLAASTDYSKDVKQEPVEEAISVASSPEKKSKSAIHVMNRNNKILLKSPTFDRHRKTNSKKKKASSLSMSGVFPLRNKELFDTPKKNNQSNKVIVNASDDEDVFDSSVIGGTPNVEISKRSKGTFNSQRKKSHSKTTSSGTTLTQMFSGMNSNDQKKDETTMMDIEEILQTVEDHEKNDGSSSTSKNSGSCPSQNKKFLNSFIADYDKLPVSKSKPTNEFVYKETVRGNEKKKLRGWACKDCENFYKGMNLSEEELEKRMNECSKHRSKFKPDDDTIPGYWNMSIPSTPADEKSPPVSPEASQNSLNESTIFCFYK